MAGTCGYPAPAAIAPRGEFEFMEPTSLTEALGILAATKHKTALLAGGTDLLRNLKHGQVKPHLVVSLARVPELDGIREVHGGLEIGALTTMSALAGDERVKALYPCLAEAAAQVGSPQVRNRATIGGNLCNASPCADTAGPVHVFNATALIKNAAGERRVPVAEFMTGPGQTVLAAGEVLVSLTLPRPAARTGSSFISLGHRKALEITVVSATARLTLRASSDEIEEVRVCLGSVAPTPMLSHSVEQSLLGRTPLAADIAAAARAAAAEASPIDDLRAGADYRRAMVEVLVSRVLNSAGERAREGRAV